SIGRAAAGVGAPADHERHWWPCWGILTAHNTAADFHESAALADAGSHTAICFREQALSRAFLKRRKGCKRSGDNGGLGIRVGGCRVWRIFWRWCWHRQSGYAGGARND